MKNNFLAGLGLLATLLLAQPSKGQQGRIYVRGQIENSKDNEPIFLLINRERREPLSETTVKNDRFSFSVTTDLPAFFQLEYSNGAVPARFFAGDGDTIVISGKRTNLGTIVVQGGALHDEYLEYAREEKSGWNTAQQNGVAFDPTPGALRFIQSHPASPVSAWLLYRSVSPSKISGEEMEKIWGRLSAPVRNGIYGNILAKRIGIVKKTDIGQRFAEISLSDTNGIRRNLSDYVKKGYVLLDFWASWCIPCRAENKYMKAAYRMYQQKHFTIYSVSLDSKKDAWSKAIVRDTLSWVHASDLQYWNCQPAKEYGVISIPANVLIAPDGTIVRKNLRGEELLKVLEEIYATEK